MSTKPFLPSEETSIPKNISTPEISRAIPREIEVGSGKRGHNLLEGTGEIHMGTKKFKGAGHGDSGGRMGEDFDGLEKDDESEQANIGHVYAEKLQVCDESIDLSGMTDVANMKICRTIRMLLAALRRPLYRRLHPSLLVMGETIRNRPCLRSRTGHLALGTSG
jgi:hypothetical protein